MTEHTKLSKALTKRVLPYTRLMETVEIDKNIKDEAQYNIFMVRADEIDSIYTTFQSIHNQIVGLIEDKQYEAQDQIRKKADEAYFSIKALIRKHQLSNKFLTPPPASPKLTKLIIPIFDGNFKNWPTFYDLFRTMVHENDTLCNVAKYQYLLTSLKDEAFNLLKGFPVTNDNYIIAYKTLKGRYQNKRHLATIYYNELISLKSCLDESPKDYRILVDTFKENVEGFRALEFPVDSWDFLLFNMLLHKLNNNVKLQFETEHSSSEIPTYLQLINFLENKAKALDSVSLTSHHKSSNNQKTSFLKGSKPTSKPIQSSFATEIQSKSNCILCQANHNLYQCPKFMEKSPSQRFEIISKNQFCKNCLGSRHNTSKCNSSRNCRVCNKRHHTLLHLNQITQDRSSPVASTSNLHNTVASITNTVASILLPVAELEIQDRFGRYHKVRALVDSCSMINVITDNLQKRLQLPRSIRSVPIEGLNNMTSNCNNGTVECYIKPCDVHQPTLQFTAVISNRICSDHPADSIDVSKYYHLQDLDLRKGQTLPGPIDILLGAELVPYILTSDRRAGNMEEPAALGSIFGWLLMGKNPTTSSLTSNLSLLVEPSLNSYLQKFWELENVAEGVHNDPEDDLCEKHFQRTCHIQNGRFMVSLPFRTSPPKLGESYSQALRRFLHMEKRLMKDSETCKKYKDFMEDYLAKGYMSPVIEDDYQSEIAYYIPHHYILNSATSKFRVVFDASAKTSSGSSLNEMLLTGPKLQNDLCSVLIKFRCFPIAFICDIKQMYRQILIVPHQRDFQRIIWRNYDTHELREYQLNTVTYGVSSSPYLALRTIKELAKLYTTKFPEASQVLQNDMYVDDIVTGSVSVQDALNLQKQIITLLSLGSFELAKWASNCPELMTRVCPDYVDAPVFLDHVDNGFIKALGLHWDPRMDTFGFSFVPRNDPCTKRAILSNIARIFDPMGLITPCTLSAKCLMQQLWLEKCDWDDVPSVELQNYWSKYKSQLPMLSQLKIPRLIQPNVNGSTELHVFSDASNVGYCAVAYLRSILPDNTIILKFICAKSRVAPLKTTSIPRLELCGAVLLADLTKFVLSSLSNDIQPKIFAWCDSMIVRGWLKSSPHRWKTFIANRTSHIQDIISGDRWYHVSSAENPADPGSRGLLPLEMIDCKLWWNGPEWLSLPCSHWPDQLMSTCDEELPEEKRVPTVNPIIKIDNFVFTLMERCSSFSKIQNIISYVLRFVAGCRKLNNNISNLSISMVEQQSAVYIMARQVQLEHFPDLIQCLHHGTVPPKPFRKLSPFIGQGNLVRVGGRLKYSDLSYDAKHPILLPSKSRLSELIVEHLHQKNLHPGYKTLHALIANQFWILSPRTIINKVLLRCIRCFRVRPKSITPLMADLPTFRVQQMKAFYTAGVDYAGPFLTTARKHRGAKTFRSYIYIFVCAVTKAVHLELVSDLTTNAFLAAFRRFIARRGKCLRLISDRGTNFVGAYNQLNQYAQTAGETLGITWLFNPPASPNFNGLTEAGVKSTKTHLKRVIGDQISRIYRTIAYLDGR